MRFCKNVVVTKQAAAVLAFFEQLKGSVTAMEITEQPVLLAKSKINRPGYKFSKNFYKNGQSNLVLVLVLILKSKGP